METRRETFTSFYNHRNYQLQYSISIEYYISSGKAKYLYIDFDTPINANDLDVNTLTKKILQWIIKEKPDIYQKIKEKGLSNCLDSISIT